MAKKTEKVSEQSIYEKPIYKMLSMQDVANKTSLKCMHGIVPKMFKRLVSTSTYDENLKRYFNKSDFKTIDRHAEMKIYRTSDFALENLISIGKELNPVSLSPSRFEVIENLSNSVSL